jgi:hypothetical protein
VTTPEEFMVRLRAFLERRAVELRDAVAHGSYPEILPPVVELYLSGVLPFERSALSMAAVEALVAEIFAPQVALVKNLTQPAAFAVATDDTLSRAALERQVLAGLFARDSRFAAASEQWASLAINLKNLALADASATALVDELAAHLAQIEEQRHADPQT